MLSRLRQLTSSTCTLDVDRQCFLHAFLCTDALSAIVCVEFRRLFRVCASVCCARLAMRCIFGPSLARQAHRTRARADAAPVFLVVTYQRSCVLSCFLVPTLSSARSFFSQTP